MAFTPRVVDIYHGDNVEGNDCVAGFQKAAEAGVWGIIHKSSQGVLFKDKAYDRRREAAQKVGLLWGAYHFNTAAGFTQANFIGLAIPADVVRSFMKKNCLAEAFDDKADNDKCMENRKTKEKKKTE